MQLSINYAEGFIKNNLKIDCYQMHNNTIDTEKFNCKNLNVFVFPGTVKTVNTQEFTKFSTRTPLYFTVHWFFFLMLSNEVKVIEKMRSIKSFATWLLLPFKSFKLMNFKLQYERFSMAETV